MPEFDIRSSNSFTAQIKIQIMAACITARYILAKEVPKLTYMGQANRVGQQTPIWIYKPDPKHTTLAILGSGIHSYNKMVFDSSDSRTRVCKHC
jgi:hypothetical protein